MEKICTKCGISKLLTEFRNHKECLYGKTSICKLCLNLKDKEYYNRDGVKKRNLAKQKEKRILETDRILFKDTKARAKRDKLPFNLTIEDFKIPECCPVLGIKLITGGKRNENTPSIDRVIPELGYIKGNVCIISWRANRIKNNGTIIDFENILKYLKNYPNI